LGGIVGFNFLQNRPPSSLSNSGYYIRGSKIYYHPGFGLAEPFEISLADRDSFVILDERYALDATYVFYEGAMMVDADPSTFELLDSPFSRDAKHVYASGEIFSDDPINFEIISENISRDSDHIYWSGNIISDDPSHLVVIWDQNYYTYLKDSTTVFVNGNPIPKADIATFEVILDTYARDAAHIFYFGEIISEADTSTFEVLGSPYGRDAESVFWMENVIIGADPNTFRVLNANFECSADAVHAYYQNAIIQNVDAAELAPDVQVNNCTATELYTNP
jgi:hypothetical protein